MARYRKIAPRMWNDEKFREFTDAGKLAFIFLLTHPNQTSLGIFRATISGLAGELGWTEKGFREALSKAFAEGLVRVDERASCVWVCNFLKYNAPESPNVVKSWDDILDLIPECEIRTAMLIRVYEQTKGLGEGFLKALPKAFGEAFRKGMPNPEPEPEPEPDINTPPSPSAPKPGKFIPENLPLPLLVDTPEIREAWRRWCQHRRERKPALTPTAADQQLQLLSAIGPVRALEALKHSTACGYQGIFEPGEKRNGNGTHPNRPNSGNPDARRAEQRAKEYGEELLL